MDGADISGDGNAADLNRSGRIRHGEDSYASFAIGELSIIIDKLDIINHTRKNGCSSHFYRRLGIGNVDDH